VPDVRNELAGEADREPDRIGTLERVHDLLEARDLADPDHGNNREYERADAGEQRLPAVDPEDLALACRGAVHAHASNCPATTRQLQRRSTARRAARPSSCRRSPGSPRIAASRSRSASA